VVRGALSAVLTAGCWIAWLLLHVATIPVPGLQRRWRRWMFSLWSRALLGVFGVRVEVVGRPPGEPGFLVCNHLSYIDIPVLAASLGPVFVAKAEIAGWPVIGMLARCMGTVFIDRGRKRDIPNVNRQIDEALAAGDGVVVFPEGTSTNGAAVAPFRTSLLAPAAQVQRPVHVASLSYRTVDGDPSASETVCWWGEMELMPHLLVFLGLKRVEARLRFGSAPVVGADRKLLAEKLWQAVDQIFIPTP